MALTEILQPNSKRKKLRDTIMDSKFHFFLLFFVFLTLPQVDCRSRSPFSHRQMQMQQRSESNEYSNFEVLDNGRYVIQWSVDRELRQIFFTVNVMTRGYVGFGLSKSGMMLGADIVLGGVFSNGTTYFTDRHGRGNQEPVIDKSQDWQLHEAEENSTHTTLKFSRALDTCDLDDYQINDQDTVVLIWSYGRSDNPSQYHVGSRGQHPINLLDPNAIPREIKQSSYNPGPPSRVMLSKNKLKLWTITSRLRVPKKATTHYCTVHQAPRLKRKHHIVGFRTRLETQQALEHTQNLQLFRCTAPPMSDPEQVWSPFVNATGNECINLNRPTGEIPTQYCTEITYVFGTGGRIMFYPDHLGQPFGEMPEEFYLLQVHYENPEKRNDIKFDVNIDVYYTDQLRSNELGILSVGHQTPGSPSLLIPPNSPMHDIYGHCGGDCTNRMLPMEGINIFQVAFRSHSAGRKIRLRQIRGKEELPWIMDDNNFEPAFQNYRLLNQEVNVQRGDHLLLRCSYDNTQSNGTVTGGLSSKHEVCLAYIYFYNRLREEFAQCRSEITDDYYQRRYLGISNSTWSNERQDVVAILPPRLANKTLVRISNTEVKWTQDLRRELQEDHKTFPQVTICPRSDAISISSQGEEGTEDDSSFPVAYPADVMLYVPPERLCSKDRDKDRNLGKIRNKFVSGEESEEEPGAMTSGAAYVAEDYENSAPVADVAEKIRNQRRMRKNRRKPNGGSGVSLEEYSGLGDSTTSGPLFQEENYQNTEQPPVSFSKSSTRSTSTSTSSSSTRSNNNRHRVATTQTNNLNNDPSQGQGPAWRGNGNNDNNQRIRGQNDRPAEVPRGNQDNRPSYREKIADLQMNDEVYNSIQNDRVTFNRMTGSQGTGPNTNTGFNRLDGSQLYIPGDGTTQEENNSQTRVGSNSRSRSRNENQVPINTLNQVNSLRPQNEPSLARGVKSNLNLNSFVNPTTPPPRDVGVTITSSEEERQSTPRTQQGRNVLNLNQLSRPSPFSDDGATPGQSGRNSFTRVGSNPRSRSRNENQNQVPIPTGPGQINTLNQVNSLRPQSQNQGSLRSGVKPSLNLNSIINPPNSPPRKDVGVAITSSEERLTQPAQQGKNILNLNQLSRPSPFSIPDSVTPTTKTTSTSTQSDRNIISNNNQLTRPNIFSENDNAIPIPPSKITTTTTTSTITTTGRNQMNRLNRPSPFAENDNTNANPIPPSVTTTSTITATGPGRNQFNRLSRPSPFSNNGSNVPMTTTTTSTTAGNSFFRESISQPQPQPQLPPQQQRRPINANVNPNPTEPPRFTLPRENSEEVGVGNLRQRVNRTQTESSEEGPGPNTFNFNRPVAVPVPVPPQPRPPTTSNRVPPSNFNVGTGTDTRGVGVQNQQQQQQQRRPQQQTLNQVNSLRQPTTANPLDTSRENLFSVTQARPIGPVGAPPAINLNKNSSTSTSTSTSFSVGTAGPRYVTKSPLTTAPPPTLTTDPNVYGREVGTDDRIRITMNVVFDNHDGTLSPGNSKEISITNLGERKPGRDRNINIPIVVPLPKPGSVRKGSLQPGGIFSFTIVDNKVKVGKSRTRKPNRYPVVDLGTITRQITPPNSNVNANANVDVNNLNQNNIEKLRPFDGGPRGIEEPELPEEGNRNTVPVTPTPFTSVPQEVDPTLPPTYISLPPADELVITGRKAKPRKNKNQGQVQNVNIGHENPVTYVPPHTINVTPAPAPYIPGGGSVTVNPTGNVNEVEVGVGDDGSAPLNIGNHVTFERDYGRVPPIIVNPPSLPGGVSTAQLDDGAQYIVPVPTYTSYVGNNLGHTVHIVGNGKHGKSHTSHHVGYGDAITNHLANFELEKVNLADHGFLIGGADGGGRSHVIIENNLDSYNSYAGSTGSGSRPVSPSDGDDSISYNDWEQGNTKETDSNRNANNGGHDDNDKYSSLGKEEDGENGWGWKSE